MQLVRIEQLAVPAAGKKLENGWRAARRAAERLSGEQLTSGWREAGKRLASGWRATGERQSHGWWPGAQCGERLGSNCLTRGGERGWRAASERQGSGLRAPGMWLASGRRATGAQLGSGSSSGCDGGGMAATVALRLHVRM